MIYVGISEAGGYAVIDGTKAETRTVSGASLIKDLRTLNAKNTRCVIEMKHPGAETAILPQGASETAYKFCRMFRLPFMVVTPGTWERDMKVNGNAVDLCKKLFPGVQIETRDNGTVPEADALLLAEYARRSL